MTAIRPEPMPGRVFAAGSIGTLRLPHRIVMGSMHLGIEDQDDGGVALAAFYAARARGGAGLIVTGGSAVSRVGAGGRHYSFVNEPAHRERLAAVARAVHEAGSPIALQLFHAGRYARRADFGLRPVAPSAVPSRFSPEPPMALDDDGIAETIADFAAGAAAARSASFDAVELMGSEGYLLNEFVSPLTNARDDAWGGDSLRRMAFPLAVVAAVRAAVGPEYPMIYRMSGADLMPGSTTPAEAAAFATALAAAGVDALNIGVGWHESRVPTVQLLVPAGTWTREAAAIKRAVGALPVISGNRVNRLEQAERILATGAADFVSMSRAFLADPELINAERAGRPRNICIGCDQACIDRSLVDERVSCLVNPDAGHEGEARRAGRVRRRFVVIGGGPAGLAAARELALRGQQVTLYEAADELGGQFRLARTVPGKGDYGETITYYAAELARLGVLVSLHCRLGPAAVAALPPADGIVLATGVRPRRADVVGVGRRDVLSYPQAFAALASGPRDDPHSALGRVAIIGGGGIGLDLAHLMAAPAPDVDRFRADYVTGVDDAAAGDAARPPARAPSPAVTVLCRSERAGSRLGRTMRWALLADLARHGVAIRTGVRYEGIEPRGVRIRYGGESALIPADTVVVAAGQEPESVLLPAVRAIGVPVRVVGGARSTEGLDAVRAFAEGVSAARDLLDRTAVRSTPAARAPGQPSR